MRYLWKNAEWSGPLNEFSVLACFKYQTLWLGVSVKQMLVTAKSLSTPRLPGWLNIKPRRKILMHKPKQRALGSV